MFANWSAVPAANLSITNAGGLLAVGTFPVNGDVKTVNDFLTVAGECYRPNPGPELRKWRRPKSDHVRCRREHLTGWVLPPEVIGFAFQCAFNPTTGKIISAGSHGTEDFRWNNNPAQTNFD